MQQGRLTHIVMVAILCLAWGAPAFAGWFGGGGEWAKSGLDLETGFDRNTVTTISGRITRLALEGADGPALADLLQGTDTYLLVLGPREYWRSKGIPLTEGSEVSARGSRAMGRDGKQYLIVERLTTNGIEVRLRNESGRPAWSGGGGTDRQRSPQMRQQFRGGRMGR